MDHTWKFFGNGILIRTLELKISHFKCFPICLYREAMRLQCFPPTRYEKKRENQWCVLFRKVLKIENWSIACLLALYGSTVHPRCIMWFSGHVFLLSVHASLKKS